MNLKALLLIPLSFLLLACSNVYRTVDHGYSDQDVLNQMNTEMGGQQSSFASLVEQNSSSFYFAISGEDFGLPQQILAMNFLDFISPSLDPLAMTNASVYFIDAVTDQGRKNELLIYVKDQNGAEYRKTFRQVSEGYIEGEDYDFVNGKKRYVVEVSDGSTTLFLSTYDVLVGSDELGSVIQLDVDLDTGEYLGRISALSGFSSF